MGKKLEYIMLIDDSVDDNFIHERAIRNADLSSIVMSHHSAKEALAYLKSGKEPPGLIFLDINMPGMNGWKFLEEYMQLDKKFQCQAIIIMLTTSDNPLDMAKVKSFDIISDYITKPLTKEKMKTISDTYFHNAELNV